MKIVSIRSLAGPNIYTHRPALWMKLDLENLYEKESFEIHGFIERLLDLLPGLREHHCSKGRAGGFVERLHEGTYFGHVVEHAALELMNLAGIPVKHGKTRASDEPRIYDVVVEYKAEEGAKFLLQAAVRLVEAVAKGEAFALDPVLEEARRIIAHTELGPSTRAIVEAAERRGIPALRIGTGSLVQLGYGKRRRMILAAMTERTSGVAIDVSCDKDLTKMMLEQASIPVPRGRVVHTPGEALTAFEELGGAVVVKPLDGRQGLGVSLNLQTPGEVAEAFNVAQKYSSAVLVEELFEGRNYRVLVVDGRMVAASERLPCHVHGDGLHTVAELVEIANRDPLRGDGHEKPLTKIKVDDIVLAHLKKTNLGLDYVAREGEIVSLRESINLSTGGVARDVTDAVHESVRVMCERAARITGLDVCGVDLVLADIAAPLRRGSGGVIEVNASPGLRMHQYPSEGRPRDVGMPIVEMLFPDGDDGRIPVFSVTGTNGKTTVTRMIAHVLDSTGMTTGMTTTDGIYIGGQLIVEGDTTGPHSARTILTDPSVDVAVLETARGGIARRGLGYDWSDISVMTNIQPDHFGQDGIESLDDLVFIKSLVAERVREGGTLVLNADDERLARLMEEPRVRRIPKRVVYFSLRENHLLLKKHAFSGGTVYFVRNNWIVEKSGSVERHVVDAARVPVTMSGTARFQIANLLACVAACRAHGVAVEQIDSALLTFESASRNPGRTNLFRVASGGYVLMDYGHNPEAVKSVCQMISSWRGRQVTGIIGVPGDRNDELVKAAGRIAAEGFERIVIKEDRDLRGRKPGEVAGILHRVIRETAPQRDCRIVPGEREALAGELRELQRGQVLVMFYDKLEALRPILEEFGAVPVASIEGLEVRPAARAAAAYAPLFAPAPTTSVPLLMAAERAARREYDHECPSYIWR